MKKYAKQRNVMPSQKNNILQSNMKYYKIPYITYVDLESLIKK